MLPELGVSNVTVVVDDDFFDAANDDNADGVIGDEWVMN
jgi:hypothetical protein